MEGRFGSTFHFHCWLILIFYISSLLVYFSSYCVFQMFWAIFSMLGIRLFCCYIRLLDFFLHCAGLLLMWVGCVRLSWPVVGKIHKDWGSNPLQFFESMLLFFFFFFFCIWIFYCSFFFILSFYVVFLHVALWQFPSKHWTESHISISTLN
jgi:hypothetical protein